MASKNSQIPTIQSHHINQQQQEHACVRLHRIQDHSGPASTGICRDLQGDQVEGNWPWWPKQMHSRHFSYKWSSHQATISKGGEISIPRLPGFVWWIMPIKEMGLQFLENMYLTAFISYQFLIIFVLIRSDKVLQSRVCVCVSYMEVAKRTWD